MSIEQLNILYINYISDQFDFFFLILHDSYCNC